MVPWSFTVQRAGCKTTSEAVICCALLCTALSGFITIQIILGLSAVCVVIDVSRLAKALLPHDLSLCQTFRNSFFLVLNNGDCTARPLYRPKNLCRLWRTQRTSGDGESLRIGHLIRRMLFLSPRGPQSTMVTKEEHANGPCLCPATAIRRGCGVGCVCPKLETDVYLYRDSADNSSTCTRRNCCRMGPVRRAVAYCCHVYVCMEIWCF